MHGHLSNYFGMAPSLVRTFGYHVAGLGVYTSMTIRDFTGRCERSSSNAKLVRWCIVVRILLCSRERWVQLPSWDEAWAFNHRWGRNNSRIPKLHLAVPVKGLFISPDAELDVFCDFNVLMCSFAWDLLLRIQIHLVIWSCWHNLFLYHALITKASNLNAFPH